MFARRSAFALALVLGASGLAKAQTATQTVTFAVNAINVISVSGSPTLTVTTAAAGSAPSTVSDATSNWAVTTNQTGAKITASIASNMPAGVTLSVNLAAPTGATSNGSLALSTTSADLVDGITKVAQNALSVTYTLAATAAAGVVSSSTRVVTYTISGGT